MSDAADKSPGKRTALWDFLPRFSCLLELGNWSQSLAERSLSVARAVAERYELVLKSTDLPYCQELRRMHEHWWMAGTPGEVRVYRVTIQCERAAVYKVRVSCDDDGSEFVLEHFAKTDHVVDNADDATRVAEPIVGRIARMF